MSDTQMVPHDCPIEGQMMIEAGKPCNWCGELDDAKVDMSDTPMPRPEEPPDGWIMHPHVREWRMYALALAARIEQLERELAEAKREIDYLRRYGNKDCTAMADAAMKEGVNDT